MAVILALEKLYDDVATLFAADGTPLGAGGLTAVKAAMPFGWREPSRQGQPPRIIWTPGNERGDLGEIAPPRYPGRNPRPLFTIKEYVTLRVDGSATGTPTVERDQWHAARLLYDALLRAIYVSAHGQIEVISHRWENKAVERRNGACIVAVISIESAVNDTAVGETALDVDAAITPSLLQSTEDPTPSADAPFTVVHP